MDALSETLRVVRLVGAIFIHGRFTAPWCYQSPHADAAAPADFDAVLLHSPRAARALAAILTPDAAQNRLAVCISAAAARAWLSTAKASA